MLANQNALQASPLYMFGGTVSFGVDTAQIGGLTGSAGATLLLSSTDGSPVALTVAPTVPTTYNGSITGSGGSLTVASGILTLGGSNTYTGMTTLNGGELVLAGPNALAGGGLITFNGGVLGYSAGYSGDISGRFVSGAWNIDTGGQSVTFATNLSDNMNGGYQTSLTKGGLGLLTLSGSNSYSGGTTINGGALAFASSAAVPPSPSPGSITINQGGGLVASSGTATTVNGWLQSGAISSNYPAGAICLTPASHDTDVNFTGSPAGGNYPYLSLGAVGNVTYGGTIEPGDTGYYFGGGGGTLWLTTALSDSNAGFPFGGEPVTINAGGTVVLVNTNSYWTGGTTIVAGGTLQLGDGAAKNIVPLNSINDNGALIIPNTVPETITASISGTGAFYATGKAPLELNNYDTVGSLYVSGGTVNITLGEALTVTGPITLTGTNSRAGTINLINGTLQCGVGSFVGGSGAGPLNLNGGLLQATSGNTNWFQGVNVVLGTSGGSIDTGTYTMTVTSAGTISGPGSLNVNCNGGTGLLVLDGTNSYTGGTVVISGLLMANSELALGPVPLSFSGSNITLDGGELRDANQGASLYLSANRGIYLGSAGGVLRAGWSNTTTVAGVISGGNLTIANDGQGYSPPSNVYLANRANTYSGSTTIGGNSLPSNYNFDSISTLSVAHLTNGGQPSSIGTSSNAASNLIFDPGTGGVATLIYSGTGDSTDRLFTVNSGQAQINSSGTGPLNFTNAGAIQYTGTQPATIALGGTYAGSNANTFAPQVTDNGALPTTLSIGGGLWSLTNSNNTNSYTSVSGGTLLISSANPNVLQTTNLIAAGGQLAFAAGVTAPNVGGLIGTSNFVLQNAASSAVTLHVGASGVTSGFGGTLSGPGGLYKTGAGVLQISGTQTYTGTTTVNSGTLQISGPGFGNTSAWTQNFGYNANSTTTGLGVSGLSGSYVASPNSGNNMSSVWYNAPVSTTVPWTTTYTYNDVTGNGADGACFVFQTQGLTALGSTAGGGYQAIAGVMPSVGLSFKIYGASDIGFFESPSSTTNIDSGDTTPTGAVNLRAANTPTNVTLSYDGSGDFTLNLTQGTASSSYYYSLSTAVSTGAALSSLLGSSTAYLGFTGATGGSYAQQVISNFTSTLAPQPGANLLPVNSQLVINAGGVFDMAGGSQAVGSLTGIGTVLNSAGTTATAILTTGNDGTNQTFSGTITGNLALTKVGSGVQTFNGTNSYTAQPTSTAGTCGTPRSPPCPRRCRSTSISAAASWPRGPTRPSMVGSRPAPPLSTPPRRGPSS